MNVYGSLKVAGVEVLTAFPTTGLFEGRQIYIDGTTYVYGSGATWLPVGGAQTSVDINSDVVYTATPGTDTAFGYSGTGSQSYFKFQNQTDQFGFSIAAPIPDQYIIGVSLPLRFYSQILGDLDGNAFQLELWTANGALLPNTLVAKSDIIRVYDQVTGTSNILLTFCFQNSIWIGQSYSPNGYCVFVTQISQISGNANIQFAFPTAQNPDGSTAGYYNFIWQYGIGWEVFPGQLYPITLNFLETNNSTVPDRFKVLGLGWDGLLDIDFLPPGTSLPAGTFNNYYLQTPVGGGAPKWSQVYPDPSVSPGLFLAAAGSGQDTLWASPLPDQLGNAGRVLTTDGTNTLWVDAGTGVLPPDVGNAGKFLGTDGLNEYWLPVFPDQTSAQGQYLQAGPGGTQIWASPLPATAAPGYLYTDGLGVNSWTEPFPPYAGNSSPGQILSSTGAAGAWIDHYPTGGISGQYLQQTAGGPIWANMPTQGDLPDPTGQAGKVVGSNGAVAIWQTFATLFPTYSGTFSKTFLTETAANTLAWVDPFPVQTGQSGKQLTTDGAGNLSWQASATGLPTQTPGDAGKYLQTNGTSASWQSVVSLVTAAVTSTPTTRTLPTLNVVYLVDTVFGIYVLTLPASPVNGSICCIKDSAGNAATNAITVQASAGLIDGQSSATIRSPFESLYLISNGTNWFTI
jgi:hypothetical protein